MDSKTFSGVVELTREQYNILSSTGTLSVYSDTRSEKLNFEPDTTIYIIVDDPKYSIDNRNSVDVTGEVINFGHEFYKLSDFPKVSINTGLTINVIDSEQEYNFELITQDKTNVNIECMNCILPINFELEQYRAYICKILDGKICILDKFDVYPYTWIYGTYLSASSGKSFTFKSDFTVSYYDGSNSKIGTYSISKIDSLYSINLNIADIATNTITTTDTNNFSYEEDTFTKTAL